MNLIERAERVLNSQDRDSVWRTEMCEALSEAIEALKPVEDEEAQEILHSLRVSWDGFGKTVIKESPTADLIERLLRENARLRGHTEGGE